MAPSGSSPPSSLGRTERMVLAAVAAVLVVLMLWLRGGLHPEAPLERLARQSPEFNVALADGRPTVVEFYADWCEACRSMAPAMERIERQQRGRMDVVLLNVDNPRWQPELERYDVNGIPQLEFFDAAGAPVGRSIGARSGAELDALSTALVDGTPLPRLAGVGAVSTLPEAADSEGATPPAGALPTPQAGPRSHG
jgi:thiol-disulfide isomerase/thioredoxin